MGSAAERWRQLHAIGQKFGRRDRYSSAPKAPVNSSCGRRSAGARSTRARGMRRSGCLFSFLPLSPSLAQGLRWTVLGRNYLFFAASGLRALVRTPQPRPHKLPRRCKNCRIHETCILTVQRELNTGKAWIDIVVAGALDGGHSSAASISPRAEDPRRRGWCVCMVPFPVEG
ncbi:hypothetical protein C8R47DRAFT_33343 [Mycena vitilis]|nr:hypothetical protein C8R47DRAFT_33343 [Mycena vitilis]